MEEENQKKDESFFFSLNYFFIYITCKLFQVHSYIFFFSHNQPLEKHFYRLVFSTSLQENKNLKQSEKEVCCYFLMRFRFVEMVCIEYKNDSISFENFVFDFSFFFFRYISSATTVTQGGWL